MRKAKFLVWSANIQLKLLKYQKSDQKQSFKQPNSDLV